MKLSVEDKERISKYFKESSDDANQSIREPKELSKFSLLFIIILLIVMLGACLGIEAAMMRERTVKNASRVIDIDLLLYEDEECYSDELTLPHPEIKNRAFVMVPLAEIFPDKKALGYDFASAYQRVDKSGVERLG